MAGRCGNHHPQKSYVVCDRPARRRHPLCSGWDRDLNGFIDWTNESYAEAKVSTPEQARVQARQAATRVTPQAAAAQGSERAKRQWTSGEQAQVRAAIVILAQTVESFTTDDVWEVLGPEVPKTPGITAMMREATRDGYIEPTDRYRDSRRDDRADHDQGRRLVVWASRVQQ